MLGENQKKATVDAMDVRRPGPRPTARDSETRGGHLRDLRAPLLARSHVIPFIYLHRRADRDLGVSDLGASDSIDRPCSRPFKTPLSLAELIVFVTAEI